MRAVLVLMFLALAGCSAWSAPRINPATLSPEIQAAWEACPETQRRVVYTSFNDAIGVRRTFYRLACTPHEPTV